MQQIFDISNIVLIVKAIINNEITEKQVLKIKVFIIVPPNISS